jgi:hypothetical protein
MTLSSQGIGRYFYGFVNPVTDVDGPFEEDLGISFQSLPTNVKSSVIIKTQTD